MKVKLLHSSPLWLASHAIRMSHDNHHLSDTSNSDDNIGVKDRQLIARVGNKLKHKSVLEQLVYWYDIDGISRACLQELARHRTARLTVKSSRYTLDEVKKAPSLFNSTPASFDWHWDIIEKFIVLTGNLEVDSSSASSLCSLQDNLQDGISNDIVKYCLPEAFKTRLQFQLDGRNLQNFLSLRTSKDALWEIRLLAKGVYDALPTEHKYLYSEYVMDNTNTDIIDDNTETTV